MLAVAVGGTAGEGLNIALVVTGYGLDGTDIAIFICFWIALACAVSASKRLR